MSAGSSSPEVFFEVLPMDVFAIPLLTTKATLLLAALALAPLLLALVALRLTKQRVGGWMIAVLGIVPTALAGLIVWQVASAQARLGDDGLVVGGGRYEVTVPLADIDVAGVVVGDADAMPRLGIRTNGIGLPGGALGWFRGDERRIFAAYSGGADSVLIPTRGDFDVLVSPADAEGFVRALQVRAGTGATPAKTAAD
jgi:hypothetical protein